MNVFELFAKLSLDKSEYEKGLGDAKSTASKVGGVIASGLKTVAGISATAITAGAGAVTAITKQAIGAYGNYEQLVGGVQKLFDETTLSLGEYAEKMGKTNQEVFNEWGMMTKNSKFLIHNAEQAFKTAGMSANTYMETVTSFSASLIKSLDGDTEKAVDYADRAIRDMSDNANTFGTSLESIQNAYQGFAKENYTMLDNLKLGYGGTKEGMKALIADASKLTDIQKELNITVEDGNLSFGNIVNAISVMQESLKIAGTTEREAMETIEGSINMLKASWQNLLTGFGNKNDDGSVLYDYIQQVVESATAVVKNVTPVIQQAIGGIGDFVAEIAPILADELPKMVTEVLPNIIESAVTLVSSLAQALANTLPTLITEVLPALVETGVNLVTSLGGALKESLPALKEAFYQLLNSAIEYIPTLLGELPNVIFGAINGLLDESSNFMEIGMNLVSAIWEGLQTAFENMMIQLPVMMNKLFFMVQNASLEFVQRIPEVLPKLLDFIQGIGDFLADQAPKLIEHGANILKTLMSGIVSAIPILVEKLPQIVITFADIINDNFPKILKLGFELLVQLVTGIIQAIPTIIANLPKIIEAIVKVIEAFNWLALGSKIIQLFSNGIKAMVGLVSKSGTDIFKSLVNAVKDLPNTFKSIGKNIIEGLWSGVKGMLGWLKDNLVKGIATAVDGVKGFLGIHSPSKLFKYMGEMCVAGMEEGSEGLFGDGSIDGNVTANIEHSIADDTNTQDSGVLALLEQYLPTIASGNQIVLDTGALVGNTAKMYNEELGRLALRSAY